MDNKGTAGGNGPEGKGPAPQQRGNTGLGGFVRTLQIWYTLFVIFFLIFELYLYMDTKQSGILLSIAFMLAVWALGIVFMGKVRTQAKKERRMEVLG